MAMCAKMDLGTAGDISGDTVACRQHYAAAATSQPNVHCPQAGPSGDDICGPNHCVPWCKLDLALCGTTAFPDEATCESQCATITYLPAMGDLDLTSGSDTFNCRIYHLEAAYANNGAAKAVHCPHTGVPSVNANDAGFGPCH
jgi:hypothetical protein